jgi:hypothetical protein
MTHISAAVSVALVAFAAADSLGQGIQKDKMEPGGGSAFSMMKAADFTHSTNGRYFSPDESVSLENFEASALGEGYAETDAALHTNWWWSFRIDFSVRNLATGEIRSDSFDLAWELAGGFEGVSGAFGGSGLISPNDGTVLGVPLFNTFAASANVIVLSLDRPHETLEIGESLTASFVDTSLNGENNAGFHIQDVFGGGTEFVSFTGDSRWTRVPAPGTALVLTGAATCVLRRHRRAIT